MVCFEAEDIETFVKEIIDEIILEMIKEVDANIELFEELQL